MGGFQFQFISAYRENYSSCYVLIRLIEHWKESLDKGFVKGAFSMDLSKAFDCIPHDLTCRKTTCIWYQFECSHFYIFIP